MPKGKQGIGIPAKSRYRSMIEQEAAKYNLPVDKSEGLGRRNCHLVRWRVWRDLYACGYSLPGIGRVANRDHSTIHSGIRQIKLLDAAENHG